MKSVPASRAALVGLMGAGKSKVGRLVASALGWPFHDLDRSIEARAGRKVADIFEVEGEDGFRVREHAGLRDLAAAPPPLVAALGGGIVLEEENRERLLRSFTVVWIRIEPAEAARRVGSDPKRPLFGKEDPAAVLRKLARIRNPLYDAVARHRVDTDADTVPKDLAARIVDLLKQQ